MNGIRLLLLFGILLIAFTGNSQKRKKAVDKLAPREQLEQQRANILEEIKRTQEQLTELQKNKNATFEELSTLQAKLNARKNLIANINKEIQIIEVNINMANTDVLTLKTELDTLKKQYAEMVRYTYKNRTSSDLIVFLLSAKSFNDGLRRLQYVKQYRGYRANQAMKITTASQRLNNKLAYLNSVKQKKDLVLHDQESQNKILENETAQKDKIITQLKGKEKQLLAGLARNKKAAEDLNRAIGNAIRREIELAQKRAMEERMKQEKLKKQQEDQVRKAALAKKQQEMQAEERRKREAETLRLAQLKKEQEEKERKALAEKQQREEKERKLALDKKEREEKERKLLADQKARQEKEKQLSKMAEAQRREKEKQLEQERMKQEEREQALALERTKQDEKQRQLLAEKQRQEENQRRLVEDKKKREQQEARNAQRGNVNNPRYVPSLANAEKSKVEEVVESSPPKETEVVTTQKSNVRVMKNDDYLYGLTPSERQISTSMESSRGNLPWPVEKGFIVEHFGKNKHPLFNIVTENYGIDIKTNRGAIARAVFPGEVSTILSIPGTGQTVIINHGTYFTVYAKLSSVSVTKGSNVGYKQKVGTVMTDEDGTTQAHFEIWKVGANGSTSKLNPELWIAN
jgi:septal ring factor EnvC (AmiA/AmiB activator)